MNLEFLKTELDRAEDALLQSEEQLRLLVALLDRAAAPGTNTDPVAVARLVTAGLALNERLDDRARRLRVSVQRLSQTDA